MSIRVKTAATGAENIYFDQRLDALGIVSDESGRIDSTSVSKVKGGMAAIQAAASDGVLDARGLAKLRRNEGFVAQVLGRDVPISAQQTRALKALTMEMLGTAGVLERMTRSMESDGTLRDAQLAKANRRMHDFRDKFNAWSRNGLRLAEVDPKSVEEFAAAWARLGQSAGEYGILLSESRSFVMSISTDWFWLRGTVERIKSNFLSAIDSTQLLQSLGIMFGGSIEQGKQEIETVSGLSPELLAAFT